jgi:membrane protease YdiL (CAAX protease family)
MFTIRLALTLLVAALAAGVVAPFLAPLVAAGGFHFPFPRILDRVVMVTMAVAIFWESRELDLVRRLRRAFAQPWPNLIAAGAGLTLGAMAIGVLWGLAWITAPAGAGTGHHSPIITLLAAVVPALSIAIIEEAFFRAFLLDGMAEDFGARAGLFASSAIYAAAHFVRSPARFQLTGIHPVVGLQTLAAGMRHLAHPVSAAPGLLGLFLLGLLLGLSFLKTGRVYFAIGLHASLIMGAKTFRKFAPGAQTAPGWLGGYGFPPLISGAAAWMITLVLLLIASRTRWERIFITKSSAGQKPKLQDVRRPASARNG